MESFSIDIAKMRVVRAPDILYALGLGSCVGVALHDPVSQIGAMVHVLLPSSEGYDLKEHSPTKFADSGIRAMLDEMIRAGAKKASIRAKMAGGAAMFQSRNPSGEMSMGQRNTESCKKTLGDLGIKLLAEDVGGNSGRSITFYTDTGFLKVKTIAHGEIII